MANLLQSSQNKETTAPGYYTTYLNDLATKGATAAQNADFVGTQPLQQKAFDKVCQNFGTGQAAITTGQGYLGCAAKQDVTGAASNYLAAGTGSSPLNAMASYAKDAMCTTGFEAGQCLVNKGAGLSGLSSATGYLGRAGNTCAAGSGVAGHRSICRYAYGDVQGS